MKLVFFAKRNLHLPHLEPIHSWIASNRPGVECVYAAPPYSPSIEGMPGLGLEPKQQQLLEEKQIPVLRLDEVEGWRPDVTITADADFSGIQWRSRIVNVNHGLISKGTFYTTSRDVLRENGADLICVPGEYHADVLRRILARPVVVTGLVKFDPVGNGTLTRARARKSLELGADDKVVLFAPTFNVELSAVPVVLDKLRELAERGMKVLVKLHGMSPRSWVELYRWLAVLEEKILFVEGQDITPCIMAADVVISDVSSAFMEAAALDRPVVLVNNPLQKTFHHYDPNDIEYRWRSVGLEVETPEQMIDAVERCFRFPEEKAELRRVYGSRLSGPIDGKSAQRAALAILKMAERTIPCQAPTTAMQ